MLATTKRHPSIVRHRTGVRADGRLTAMDIDVLLDGGAYCTLCPVVLSRGVIHATGPYRCDHVRIRGRAMMTNTPPNGAFRGFGAPQTQFAAEVHVDRVAEALGLDPVRFRDDQRAPPRRHDRDRTAARPRRERAARCSARRCGARDFRAARRRWRGTNRGIGLSLFFHGSGFTGAGEVKLASRAALELTARGARILVGEHRDRPGHAHDARADRGRRARHRLTTPSRSPTPTPPRARQRADGRVAHLHGRRPDPRALRARDAAAARRPRRPPQYLRRHGPLVDRASDYERPPGHAWDDDAYRGDAYGAYGWGCNVAEVDDRPRHVRGEAAPRSPRSATSARRSTRSIAAGQIEGGTVQGIGLRADRARRDAGRPDGERPAHELHHPDDPRRAADRRRDPRDAVRARAVRAPRASGEMPIDGPAPAIVNAIRHAGFDVRAIPATPESPACA